MRSTPSTRSLTSPAVLLAAGVFVLHLVLNATTPYGVHRDELLYLAMGDHLRLWRMDFPPFIALAANLQRTLFGHGLVAIRVLPALSAAAIIVVASEIARVLGGRTWARAIAALGIAANLLFLRAGGMLQPVVFDQLWWTLALYALVRVEQASSADVETHASARWWIFFGWAAGVGLLTKFSALIFGFAVLVAIVATPLRRALRTPWPWLAGILAFIIGAPSITGQLALHFPVVGQMSDLGRGQLEHVTLATFFGDQLLWSPVAALLGITGLAALLSGRIGGGRTAGWAALFTLVLLAALHGKSYYAGPVHPLLIAAGAVAFERWIGALTRTSARLAARALIPVGAVAYVALVFPLAAPVLAPARMEAYDRALGIDRATANNQGEQERLPQDYADMLPWRAQAEAVAAAWRSLTPAERAVAVTGAGNYGEAGAIDYYAESLGIPHAISGAGSYWFFGPGTRPGAVAVVLGDDRGSLGRLWEDVREFTHVREPYGVGEERDVTVWICRSPRRSLQEVWPTIAAN